MQLRNIDRATASASRRRIATIGRVIPVFVVLGLIWATGRTPNERLAAQTGPGVLNQNLSVRYDRVRARVAGDDSVSRAG